MGVGQAKKTMSGGAPGNLRWVGRFVVRVPKCLVLSPTADHPDVPADKRRHNILPSDVPADKRRQNSSSYRGCQGTIFGSRLAVRLSFFGVNVGGGLVNGTSLRLLDCGQKVLHAMILNGSRAAPVPHACPLEPFVLDTAVRPGATCLTSGV